MHVDRWSLGFIWLFAVALVVSLLGHAFPDHGALEQFGRMPQAPYFVAFVVAAALWLSIPMLHQHTAMLALAVVALCLSVWSLLEVSFAPVFALILVSGASFRAWGGHRR